MNQKQFLHRYGPWALVLGAAQGIGRAYCMDLAERGLNLVLVDLDEGGMAALSRRLPVETRSLCLDLSSLNGHEQIAEATADLDLGLLVFNAAHSTVGAFLDTSLANHLRSVDVNARSVLACLHKLSPRLVARGRGGLLLMSSLAGLGGTALVASYAATKAFDLVLAESLWAEFQPLGIDVLAAVAGPTDTPGFRRSRARMAEGLIMSPEQVAAEALAHLRRGPVHVCGRMNRLTARLRQHVLPRGLAAAWMRRTMSTVYRNPAPKYK